MVAVSVAAVVPAAATTSRIRRSCRTTTLPTATCTRAAAAVPGACGGLLRRPRRHQRRARSRLVPRAAGRVRAQPRHRARPSRRARRRRGRQPAHVQRRQPRRRRRAEGRPLRAVVRLLQHRGHHVRRHQRLPPGPRPRMARDHPSRRAAAARVRGGDRAAPVRRAAEGVRRRVHRDGLTRARHRLVRRLAHRRDRGDGRAAGGRRPVPPKAQRDRRSRRARRARNARSRWSTRSASSIPYVAAERGYVDDVIAATDTRRALAGALERLSTKREHQPRRRHSNSPL